MERGEGRAREQTERLSRAGSGGEQKPFLEKQNLRLQIITKFTSTTKRNQKRKKKLVCRAASREPLLDVV